MGPLWPSGPPGRVHRVVRCWLNVYLPADVLGRAVFHDATDTQFLRQGTYWPRADWVNPGGRIDVCLKGRGGHTSYWGNPEMTAWLDGAIADAAGQGGCQPPPGYAPGMSDTRGQQVSSSTWQTIAGNGCP